MADARTRELERRWVETGTDEAGARFLRTSVRVGLLPAEWLAVAAYLGHGAAKLALGDDAPEPPPPPTSVRIIGPHGLRETPHQMTTWCNAAAGSDAFITTGHPTCRACLGSSVWRSLRRDASRQWVTKLIEVGGILSGRRVAVATVREVLAWCRRQRRNILPNMPWGLFEANASGWSYRTSEERLEQATAELERLRKSLLDALPDVDPSAEVGRIVRIVDGAAMIGWDDLMRAVCAEVVPWALGLDTLPMEQATEWSV